MHSSSDTIYSIKRPTLVLLAIVLTLSLLPVLDVYLILRDSWQGILPSFSDDTLYRARIQNVAEGHLTGGNPYLLEHVDDPPLVIFGGVWINAIPQLLGLPENVALLFNFILWSLLFALSLQYLFRAVAVPEWMSVVGTVLVYLQSYQHVIRPANLQTVYPFFFLLYYALWNVLCQQSRKNVLFLGIIFGTTFYLYSYLWQTAIITLTLLFLYALMRKNWPLLRAALWATGVGVVIGLPMLLYALWLSYSSPYFWESVYRLGLVNTHLPMAEVMYSGAWIGVVLVLLAVLYWRVQLFREDRSFARLILFFTVSGLGLWTMQGSNLVTGKLLETGEHLSLLIQPWLFFATISIGVFVWGRRTQISKELRVCSAVMIVLLLGVSGYYAYPRFSRFLPANVDRGAWHTQQLYAKPLTWLDETEKNPVVVWSNPHNYLAAMVPTLTKHFSLYAQPATFELVSEAEIRERYLVSEYYDNPTLADLKSEEEMSLAKRKEKGDLEAKKKLIEIS